MVTITNQAFRDETLSVDGNEYVGCTFTDVVFVYGGGALPTFTKCLFSDVALQFEGAAASTLKFLNGLAANGYPAATANIVENIRDGNF